MLQKCASSYVHFHAALRYAAHMRQGMAAVATGWQHQTRVATSAAQQAESSATVLLPFCSVIIGHISILIPCTFRDKFSLRFETVKVE